MLMKYMVVRQSITATCRVFFSRNATVHVGASFNRQKQKHFCPIYIIILCSNIMSKAPIDDKLLTEKNVDQKKNCNKT